MTSAAGPIVLRKASAICISYVWRGTFQNSLHNIAFGVSIILSVFPAPLGQLAFCLRIQFTIFLIRSQMVSKQKEAFDLTVSLTKNVYVKIDVLTLEETVFVPVGLAYSQRVSSRFERRHIGNLVSRTGDDEKDVDDRFRYDPGYRG